MRGVRGGANKRSRRWLVVASVFAFVAGAGVGVGVTRVVPTSNVGIAAEVVVQGEGTGFMKLAVRDVPHLPFVPRTPGFSSDSGTAGRSNDQLYTERRANELACQFLGVDLSRCATNLVVTGGGRSTGLSAMLPSVLAVLDHRIEISGDVRVAATGMLTSVSDDAPPASILVGSVAGVPAKVEAAAAAGADVVLVPLGNAGEVPPDAGVQVVAVASLQDAVEVVCARSLTSGCANFDRLIR